MGHTARQGTVGALPRASGLHTAPTTCVLAHLKFWLQLSLHSGEQLIVLFNLVSLCTSLQLERVDEKHQVHRPQKPQFASLSELKGLGRNLAGGDIVGDK